MGYTSEVTTSSVELCSRTHYSLILTIFLVQTVRQTSPQAQYPIPQGQIPPYDVQYPDPNVDIGRGGYQGDGSVGFRRLDNQLPRVSGQDLRALLQRVDFMLSNQCTKNVVAQWQFETNVNTATQQAAVSLLNVSLSTCAFVSGARQQGPGDEVTGDWRRRHNEELLHTSGNRIKKHGLGGACGMYGGQERYIECFGEET
jgi:hypothetical protein